MSTAAASSYISPTADIFNQPSTDFALLERPGVLSERYRLRLPSDTQAYVLELCQLGLDREAEYVANCCTRGMLLYRCPSGDYGEAVLHTCHDPGCRFCGRGYSRLLTWARTHDIDRVVSEPFITFELIIQNGVLNEKERLPDRTGNVLQPSLSVPRNSSDRNEGNQSVSQPMYVDTNAISKARRRILRSFKRFIAKTFGDLEVSTLSHSYVDGTSSDIQLRVALHGASPNFTKLNKAWKEIEPAGYVNLKRDLTPQKQLEWVFSGLESMLLLDGKRRAQVRASLKHSRLIRTTGRHFRPMSKPELAAFNTAHAAHDEGILCPKCRLHTLEHIPPEKRISLPAEEVEKECDTVKWGGGLSPLRSTRVIYKGGTSDNFGTMGQLRMMPTHSPPI